MRRYSALVCWLSLAAADLSQLQQLTEKRRFFELRRESKTDQAPFYRAEIASRFGHEMEGIKLFEEVLADRPSPEIARMAHEEMGAALERLGRYKEASEQWAEALRLTPASDPDRSDNENGRVLLESLSDVPPQTADFGEDRPIQATRNGLGSWNVPVTVNGVQGDWIFDTGANTSTITESEARRMGLAVRRTKAYVGGSTDRKNAMQLAVAKDLQLGGAHIHNVVFLVLADQGLRIDAVHYQITGILGLPALRAMGRIAVSNAGQVRIHPESTAASGAPNLFFDGETPMIKVDHNQHHLQMFLGL